MQIGEPLRTIVVEPLELPVNQPPSEPEPIPVRETERVAAGIRVARQNGKRLGRPRVTVSTDEILRLRADGQSSRKIAAALGIGEGTVRDRLNSQARKTSVVSGS